MNGNSTSTAGGVHGVARNDETVNVVVGVPVDVRNFATVDEGVSTDGEVVGSVFTARVRVRIRRQVHQDTNHAVVEVVVCDDSAVSTGHGNARILVVEAGTVTVSTEVSERAVGHLEFFKRVVVRGTPGVLVRHGTVDNSKS